MELEIFLRSYRKSKKLSVRKFAEMLDVNKFRLEKWEQGIHPNYEDELKVKKYFGVKDFQNFSEDFVKTFQPRKTENGMDEVIKMKDMLIEEKDKRIHNLEETINILKESMATYQKEINVSKTVSKR